MHASLNTRHDRWVDFVQEAHNLIFKGTEVHQMMLVVGEEGIGLDDLVVYLKSEIVDAVCLQQDSFDPVDQATSRERQISDFLLLMAMVHHPFQFESTEQAKGQMSLMSNLFFQLKYCPFGEKAYQRYRSEIEAILEGKGAAH
jgi:V/A-type H+-transporting ATPase subunit A